MFRPRYRPIHYDRSSSHGSRSGYEYPTLATDFIDVLHVHVSALDTRENCVSFLSCPIMFYSPSNGYIDTRNLAYFK